MVGAKGGNGEKQTQYGVGYKMRETALTKTEKVKDLGVVMHSSMSSESHINKIVGEALALLANVRMALNFLYETIMKKILTSVIRPRVEYVEVIS